MAEIEPFAGIHYNPEYVTLAEVIAPPYDVLSSIQQDALYEQHPDNIVRLMLNKETNADSDTDNRYTRSAEFLQKCLTTGIMVQDSSPALYEYVQIFEHPLEPERSVERITLFVALKLEPYENGVVLPHEETHPKAKADRLKLMRATCSNPEPIYGLYEDPTLAVVRTLAENRRDSEPFLLAMYAGKTGPDREQHLLYRHTGPRVIENVIEFFKSRRVWIADGHHRYETALNYQAERNAQRADSGKHASDSILIGLSAFEDPGLVVLPTHRLVKNISSERIDQLELLLERYFLIESMPVAEARNWIKEEIAGEKRFVILHNTGALALILRDMALVDAAADGKHCEAWRHLDVTILQSLVLDRSLGISWTALAHTQDVAYTRDEEEAVQKVAAGEYQLACLLQNPTVMEVRDVASAGDKMPQKSTFFFPKLWSGLIIRSLK